MLIIAWYRDFGWLVYRARWVLSDLTLFAGSGSQAQIGAFWGGAVMIFFQPIKIKRPAASGEVFRGAFSHVFTGLWPFGLPEAPLDTEIWDVYK